MRKCFIGANWKCNNSLAETQGLVGSLLDQLQFNPDKVDVIVAPIYLHLVTVAFTKKNQSIEVAAQNCSRHGKGAFTGEIAAEQIKDINISWVILGHSERRNKFHENDEDVAEKVEQAFKNHLKVIFCFGETLAEREAEQTIEVVKRQLDAIKGKVTSWNNIVLAYQPVWAIGTGKNATVQQVDQVHKWIREYLNGLGEQTKGTRIIYGGSVNENNCSELIKVSEVDGFLVGGASLKPAFLDIVKAAEQK